MGIDVAVVWSRWTHTNERQAAGISTARSFCSRLTKPWDIGGITSSEDQITIEAQKLVSRRPTLILVWGNVAAAQAAKDATRTC